MAKNIENIKLKFRKISNYILIIFLIMLFLSLLRNIAKTRKASNTILEKEARVNKLRQDNEALEKKITEMKSPEYIERQIRDNLGLTKEGEIVIVLPDSETLKSLAPVTEEEEEILPDPNWKKWLKLFL